MENKSSVEYQREKEAQGCKMFIGGLTSDTTKEMLEDYYSRWGEVIDSVVMFDADRPRGFGFVTYSSSRSVDDCIREAPHKVDNKTVETKRAIPREDCTPQARAKTKKVFLGGLHIETTKEDLRPELEIFGDIEDLVVMYDKNTNRSRGFGFVTYTDYDSADKLCAKRRIRIQDRDVEVKKAASVEEMRTTQVPYGQRPPGYPPDYRMPPPASSRNRYIPPPQQQSYYNHHASSQPPPPPRAASYSDYMPPPHGGGSHYRSPQDYVPPPATYDAYSSQSGYRTGPPSYDTYGSYSGGGGYGGGAPSTGGYSSGGYSSGGYNSYSMSGSNGAMGGSGGSSYVSRSQGGASSRSYHPYRRQ